MGDRTIQDKIFNKREALKKTCIYGLKHFCDGTPNLSAKGVGDSTKAKERCPEYGKCEIRKHSIFEEKEDIYK